MLTVSVLAVGGGLVHANDCAILLCSLPLLDVGYCRILLILNWSQSALGRRGLWEGSASDELAALVTSFKPVSG